MAYDAAIAQVADYVVDDQQFSAEAYSVARWSLLDSLGCALLALQYPACKRVLGPIVPGAILPEGARVPGTDWALDPVQAAFNIGTMIRWLDYNDTWLAAEWGHPSDNFGGLLAVSDYRCRQGHDVTVGELLHAAIQAYEIQGVLALKNSFNRLGWDHVILVRVATAAVAARMLRGGIEAIQAAVSQAWIDAGTLRCYRHHPNTGSRKSWAAGDATSRGVFLALLSCRGEMGYPHALSTPKWGFHDVVMRGEPLTLSQPMGSYVMENVLFKISYPAEFHAQTAVEAAVQLHPLVRDRLEEIETIVLTTHESAVRIIDKKGPLRNPADRDHCLQYMVAVGLLFGHLTAEHYEEVIAADPRLDLLREKMRVQESPEFSRDYLDPAKRSIANAITIRFRDGSSLQPVEVHYPVGHKRRRSEAIPLLQHKFEQNAAVALGPQRVQRVLDLFQDLSRLSHLSVSALMDLLT